MPPNLLITVVEFCSGVVNSVGFNVLAFRVVSVVESNVFSLCVVICAENISNDKIEYNCGFFFRVLIILRQCALEQ